MKSEPLIPDPGPYTLEQMLACIRRELEKRAKCYPRWVQNHEEWLAIAPEQRETVKISPWKRTRMTREEAEHETGVLLAIEQMLEELKDVRPCI